MCPNGLKEFYVSDVALTVVSDVIVPFVLSIVNVLYYT